MAVGDEISLSDEQVIATVCKLQNYDIREESVH